jgi:hypothetical protein
MIKFQRTLPNMFEIWLNRLYKTLLGFALFEFPNSYTASPALWALHLQLSGLITK